MVTKILCIGDDDRFPSNRGERIFEIREISDERIAVCSAPETIDFYKNLLEYGDHTDISECPDLIILDLQMSDLERGKFLADLERLFLEKRHSMPKVDILTTTGIPDRSRVKWRNLKVNTLSRPLSILIAADFDIKLN